MFFSARIPTDACFAYGDVATTVEHVIPRWLLRRFRLWDEFLRLPNLTAIPYRQLHVPACQRCNELFGKLETLVKANCASELDIWNWANKMHYGLLHKDRMLAWNRAEPTIKVGDVIKYADRIERSRHFLHCVIGDFKTYPAPFGSVFTFRLSTPQPFCFAHMMESASVGICLEDATNAGQVCSGLPNR